jgi:hypothetical protein
MRVSAFRSCLFGRFYIYADGETAGDGQPGATKPNYQRPAEGEPAFDADLDAHAEALGR